ncbi:hypothetical protein NA57DRAFT_55585 [Rhizodiscina lignyota]|uniref:NAD(P)-binding domain-containing protein n=1 Tax=Rhizodiscina lignyota TaxID=1504668 RepID=A0A9P4IGL2_9PEZI|nr:hypothetical protein NA57DRAFT_55585 [Rhizodiscina lignyota]
MPSQEHILVLGATGVSGLIFVKQVQKLPESSRPRLTLYVRSRAKLTEGIKLDSSIRTYEGALDNEKALSDAMSDGVTTVVSFLGAYPSLKSFLLRSKTPLPITDAMPTIFSAMRSNNVKRIFVLSTPGGYRTKDEPPLTWYWYIFAYVMPKLFVPQGGAEMQNIAEVTAKQDDLDWTIYRVPHLNEDDENRKVIAGPLDHEYKGTIELSRGSLGKWILKEIEERQWIKGVAMVSNPS